jgi:carboxypeptidase PM20D1
VLKKIVLALGVAALALLSIVLWRAARFTSRQIAVAPASDLEIDSAALAQRLARAIRFRTVSYADRERIDGGQFAELRSYIETTYPRVQQRLKREVVGSHSLLFTWPGKSVGSPILLIGHLDVVPVEDETLQHWTHPPFDGVIADGYVWGRGAMDDKGSVFGLLEAAEALLGQGFEPSTTIHFAFGHDEEIGGSQGARAVAALLEERGVKPSVVLDEGGSLVAGFLPGMAQPVATVGIAEKGYLSVELKVQAEGGHSSVPPPQTAIGILSAAVERLEQNQVPANLDSIVRQTLDYLGPELPLLPRLVAANLWLFGPLMETVLSRSAPTNATIRTTTAVTMFEAGVKDNILPTAGRAVVNFRILPGDTVASVVAHVRKVVDDPRIEVNASSNSSESSPVSPADSEAFRTIHRTVREIFPSAVVAPSLVLGATDARYYAHLTPNAYRFIPILLSPDDVRRFHGIDERLGVEAYATAVRFYTRLIRNLAS